MALRIAAAVGLALLVPVRWRLASALLDACGAAAASRYEVGFESIGLATSQIKPDEAIEACKAALAEDPTSIAGQGLARRGPTVAAGQYDLAAAAARGCGGAGNVLAQTLLGDMLITGRWRRRRT